MIEHARTVGTGEEEIIQYKRLEELGKGAYGACFRVQNVKTKLFYACKTISKTKLNRLRSKKNVISEVQIHARIKHPHICGFESMFDDANYFYIILELCPHKTLEEMVSARGRLTELEAQYFGSQILEALSYLES